MDTGDDSIDLFDRPGGVSPVEFGDGLGVPCNPEKSEPCASRFVEVARAFARVGETFEEDGIARLYLEAFDDIDALRLRNRASSRAIVRGSG